MTTAMTKKIFIGDIHMGDERSFADPHPYGWFRSNIANLANFLTEQLRAPEVAEVVILGDLFDEWLIPTDVEPLNSFQAICDNPHNSPIIEALRQLAGRGILTYVPGNHDMTLSNEVLEGNKKFMEAVFPGVRYCFEKVEPSCPNLLHGVYRSGKLVAEHGNPYALCNASDTWTNPPSYLPIGYFLSRMVAYKASKTETKEDFLGTLKKFIMKFKRSRNIIKDLFMAMAKDAGLTKDDPINMHGIPGFPGTVGEIGSLYEHLIEKWKEKRPDIDWKTALFRSETGDLLPAASHIYLSPSGSGQNIVIFGHTHNADLRKPTILEASPAGQHTQDLPSRWIYANCGTWVDSAPQCTYVATQEDTAAGRQYVRLFAYPSNTLLQEGFVKL
jgi:UDP-2,3-diacylglucosamine pyrophosphatase LpxH